MRLACSPVQADISSVRFLALSNITDYAPRHYVDIGLVADWESGEPEVKEPEKCESWNWYSLDELPEPLFSMVYNYLEAYTNGNHYYDAR